MFQHFVCCMLPPRTVSMLFVCLHISLSSSVSMLCLFVVCYFQALFQCSLFVCLHILLSSSVSMLCLFVICYFQALFQCFVFVCLFVCICQYVTFKQCFNVLFVCLFVCLFVYFTFKIIQLLPVPKYKQHLNFLGKFWFKTEDKMPLYCYSWYIRPNELYPVLEVSQATSMKRLYPPHNSMKVK